MLPPADFLKLLLRLFRHVSYRRRRQFVLLLCLALVGSFLEIVSLGAVIPFIGILTQPERVFTTPSIACISRFLGIASAADLVVPLVVAFALAAVLAGSVRLLLAWVGIRLANATGTDLGIDVYRRTLYQPYWVHISRSSSEIISGITQKVGTATNVLISIAAIATSAMLFVAILTTLFVVDPMVATVSVVIFGLGYGIIVWWTRSRLLQNSRCIAKEQTKVIKALQEGLGAIRDVLMDCTQGVYCNIYRGAIQRLYKASGENIYMNQSPRYIVETLGLVLISVVALLLSYRPGGVAAELPLLGALALGAQRLLPLLQQLYGNWSGIVGNQAALVDVLDLLDQPLPDDVCQPAPPPLIFRDVIHIDNVHFKYTNSGPCVLDGVNLFISRGARVGFVGSTGSGKSTLLDLLMSLLEPTQGRILVDGQPISGQLRRAWQRVIAHVPQNIYLADSTVAENIAFGIPLEQIDFSRVRQAAKQAQIADFIEGCSGGYDTFVGERGVRLSGGQRQRIGIARALYKQAKVLVFDEATSALDSATEQEVMHSIENLNQDLTILIVAHRITTLQHCDILVQLSHGQIAGCGSYEQFISKDSSFLNSTLSGGSAELQPLR